MSPHFDYLNSNGLVDGNIPPKTECPWSKECPLCDDKCPDGNNKLEYSCACARAYSICEKPKN